MESLVSILIPTYNRLELLKKAIKSCLMQEYKNLDIVISDNHSEDGTEKFVKNIKDKRIRYFRNNNNIGPILNWRNAFEKSKGVYTIILSDDDYFLDKTYISSAVELLDNNSDVNLVITDCIINRKNKETVTNLNLPKIIPGKYLLKRFWTHNFVIPVISNVFRRKIKEKINFFYDNKILFSDIELWLKLMCLGNVGYIKKISVVYNLHESNIIMDMNRDEFIENSIFIKKVINVAEKYNKKWRTNKLRINLLNRYIIIVSSLLKSSIDYELYKKILKLNNVNKNILYNYLRFYILMLKKKAKIYAYRIRNLLIKKYEIKNSI